MEPSIGEQLRSRRLKKNLSLQQVAEATHIRLQFLEALENDRFADLPSNIQARGFIRLYASQLDLDATPLLAALESQPATSKETVETESNAPAEITVDKTSRKKKKEPEPIQETITEPPEKKSLSNYKQIGEELARRRESLGLTLEDIENHTHIKRAYLELLEQGRLDELSSPMQARGLLSNYTEFLNLDGEEILGRFAETLSSQRDERFSAEGIKEPKKEPLKKSKLTPLRQLLSADLIVGIVLIAAVFVFIIWGAGQLMTSRTAEADLTALAVADALISTFTTTPQGTGTLQPTEMTVTPGAMVTGQDETTATPQPTTTVIIVSNAALQVNITANQRSYLRVVADGVEVYDDRVAPGNAYQFTANNRIELITGNGAALDVVFNQTDLGTIGNMGQSTWLVFTRAGVQTPTMQYTPTATNTQPPTLTPRLPTSTPTATVTILVPNP